MQEGPRGGVTIDDTDLHGLDLGTETAITNPLTGRAVDIDDIDDLIDNLAHVGDTANRCYAVNRMIASRLANLTTGEKKTRRIEGARRRAKIEMPGDSWDQKILRDAWDKYPGLADRCLKIATIGVQIVEYKKLLETTGLPVLEEFKTTVKQANRGATGTPTVTIEE